MLVDIFAVREHLDELRSGVDEASNLVTSRPISVGISTPLDQLQGIVGDTLTWPLYLELFDRPVAVRKATQQIATANTPTATAPRARPVVMVRDRAGEHDGAFTTSP